MQDSNMRFSKQIFSTVLFTALVFSTGCTEPGKMTGVGAATGGVIGAGLGAIVGNQTGDAGAGVAIGAMAGAGAGAAVGNALQAQDETIRGQDEALERQDQMIQAQRSEIDELRRLSQDNVRFRPQGARSSVGTTSPDSAARASLSPQAAQGLRLGALPSRPPEPPAGVRERLRLAEQKSRSGSSVASSGGAIQEARPPVLRRANPPATEAIDSIQPTGAIVESEPVEQQEEPAAIEPVVKQEVAVVDQPATVDAHGTSERNLIAPQEPAAQVAAVTQKELGPSDDCIKAEGEFSEAKNRNDAPEKLFHIRRALRLCPNNAGYHAALGDVYLSLGRRDDARFEYSEALKFNSNLPEVTKKLEELKSDTY